MTTRRKHYRHTPKVRLRSSAGIGACLLGGAILAGLPTTQAVAQSDSGSGKLEKIEKENQELRKRLDTLEGVIQKEGLLPTGAAETHVLKALSDSTISGFVTASYFHDTSNPPGGTSPGYLWNRRTDSFSLNKVKLTLASTPVERSGDKFDAAYRVSLIFGQDAPIVNSSAGTIGFDNLREAYVEMNVPIGTGLNVKAGELISLLNYESGDGGAANDNFSQGYQWFYTGNGPAAGVQIGYTFTDWLDVKVRAQNGLYAGPVDNNKSKTGVISFGIKPCEKAWINLIGWAGREDAFSQHVQGGSLLAGWQINDKLHFGTELDYFNFRTAGKDSEVWSAGGWLSYAITEKVMPALRVEIVSDKDGADASGDPLGFAPNTGHDFSSVAFTLNIKPLPNVKIQPEVRYDHSSLANAFGKEKDRVIFGVGVVYLF